MTASTVCFEIREPLCSWGVSGATIVPTQPVPTWSAIVGMLGAALGLPRGDNRLLSLAQDYALAVEVIRPGKRMFDYHTIQAPTGSQHKANPNAQSRREELGLNDFGLSPNDGVARTSTILTRREYIQDAHYRVFVVPTKEAPVVAPDALVAALARPVYPLSAGRRSCVIGRIPAKLVALDEVEAATHWDYRIALKKPVALTVERRDQLVGNRRFGPRLECMALASKDES